MTQAGVEERLDTVAGRLNAAHAELVDVAVELLADRTLWESWQCGSVEGFLAWRTGTQPSTARKIVDIARRVDDLPECLHAFRAGLLSLDQMAPVARKVPWWADTEICRQAQFMTVRQVSRTASKYPWVDDIAKPDGTVDAISAASQPQTDTDTDAAVDSDAGAVDETERTVSDEVVAASSMSMWWGDDGRLRLSAELDPTVGSILEAALVETRDSLFQHGAANVDWAMALGELAERSLDTVQTPARRSRFKVHVHIDADGTVSDATGRPLSRAAAAGMTCDGDRVAVTERDGVPVSVGRSQRIVPDRTRQLVIHRDGGCRVPGCDHDRWLDVHHIVHWAEGGATDLDNLIALCGFHHRMHHRNQLGIEGDATDPDGVSFTAANGQPISGSGARPSPPGPRTATDHTDTAEMARYKPALRERLHERWQHFNLPTGHRHRWSPHAPTHLVN